MLYAKILFGGMKLNKSIKKRKKLDWSELIVAAKSLGKKNVVLIIIFYACMNYSCYYKNGFRGLLIMDDYGISATVYGTMISVFLICGMLMRTPTGAVIDKFRKNIKPIFIISSIIKGSVALVYLYARTTTMVWIAFIMDGFLWSFVGVLPFALLATFVDRRIVGTAFSLCEGISFIVGSSARGLGAKMFTALGPTIPSYISFGIQLLGVLAICFFDNKKIVEEAEISAKEKRILETKKDSKVHKNKTSFLRSVFGIFSLAALPFAILNGAQYILYQIDASFLPYYAEKMSFDYLTSATLGGAILGVIGVVIGVFCDIVNPVYFVLVAFTGQMAAPFILAKATTSSMFGIAVMVYYLTNCYYMPMSILAVRNSLNAEQGKVQGTLLFFMDFFSIIGNMLLGRSIDSKGYSFTFQWLGFLGIVLLIAFVILMIHLNKKEKRHYEVVTNKTI